MATFAQVEKVKGRFWMIGAEELIARCRDGVVRLSRGAVFVFAGVALAVSGSAHAGDIDEVQDKFDSVFGTELRKPEPFSGGAFEKQLAAVAEASQGRIGVAAMDLSNGRTVSVLGNQRFPMASTSKIAIAATFLEGVERGKWTLDTRYPLLVPVPSAPHSSAVAPVRPGTPMSARQLIELMITRSNNYATDALLKAVGGPPAVNAWVRKAGIDDWHIDRDIATLVRDDGAVNPAITIDNRDSATPLAMVELLSGIYQGKWLSRDSRQVILGAMGRCVTGKRRMRAGLPAEVALSHKTGTLNNTASDVGIMEASDGHVYAIAIYVTGQGGRPARDARIARIAGAVYKGYAAENAAAFTRTARVEAN